MNVLLASILMTVASVPWPLPSSTSSPAGARASDGGASDEGEDGGAGDDEAADPKKEAHDAAIEALRTALRAYRATGSGSRERAALVASIAAAMRELEDAKREDAVAAVAAFYIHPDLDEPVTRTLSAIGTKAARLAMQEVLSVPIRASRLGRSLVGESRKARILAAATGFRGSFSSSVMQGILASDPHEEAVQAALDFLAPRLTDTNAIAVFESLEEAAGGALAGMARRRRIEIFVEFYRRAFSLTRGAAPDEARSDGAYVRRLSDDDHATVTAFLVERAVRETARSDARSVALETLGALKHARVPELVRDIWSDEDAAPELVVAATKGAIAYGDPALGTDVVPVIDRFVRAAQRDRVLEEDLVFLIESIWPLRVEGAEKVIRKFLRSNQLYLRAAAVVSLPVLGDKGLKSIGSFLADDNWRLRLAAIEACRRLRNAEAVDLLIERMGVEKGRLQFDLLLALHELSGVAMPYVPADWEKWWSVARLAYRPPEERPAREAASTFVHFPDAPDVSYFGMRVLSNRLAFVLDVSGSMAAEMTYQDESSSRIDVLKGQLTELVKSFRKGTFFNVYFFETGFRALFKQLTLLSQKSYREVEAFVRNARAQGGTNLFDPLAEALEDPHVDTIYLLSDGEPSAGRYTETDDILRAVREINVRRGVQINTISIGADSELLRKLAEQNFGEYRAIADD